MINQNKKEAEKTVPLPVCGQYDTEEQAVKNCLVDLIKRGELDSWNGLCAYSEACPISRFIGDVSSLFEEGKGYSKEEIEKIVMDYYNALPQETDLVFAGETKLELLSRDYGFAVYRLEKDEKTRIGGFRTVKKFYEFFLDHQKKGVRTFVILAGDPDLIKEAKTVFTWLIEEGESFYKKEFNTVKLSSTAINGEKETNEYLPVIEAQETTMTLILEQIDSFVVSSFVIDHDFETFTELKKYAEKLDIKSLINEVSYFTIEG